MIDINCNGFFRNIHKLHVMGELEGLLVVLKPAFTEESDNRKYRATIMINCKPKIYETSLLGTRRDPVLYTNYVRTTLKLTETAQKFCVDNTNATAGSTFAPTKVIVKNISFKVKQKDLWTFFERYGKVLRATVVTERRGRRSRGFGFVVFASPLSAEKALKAKKTELVLNGRCMFISPGGRKRGPKQASMYSASRSIKAAISQYMEENTLVNGLTT